MVTFGTILFAMILVGIQVLHAREVDRRLLAKWKRLPVWVHGAPLVHRRKSALAWHIWSTGFMAAVLTALSLWYDVTGNSVRSDRQMIVANIAVMTGWSLFYVLNWHLQKRWMRTGKPTVRDLKWPGVGPSIWRRDTA